jgi:hypothetical protein
MTAQKEARKDAGLKAHYYVKASKAGKGKRAGRMPALGRAKTTCSLGQVLPD